MKRIAVVLGLTAAISTFMSASAAEITVGNCTNEVIVTEKFSVGGSGILMVLKKGSYITDDESMLALKTASVDSDGAAVWNLYMPEEYNGELIDGEYDLYIREDGVGVEKVTMVYSSVKSRQALVSEFNEADSKDSLTEIFEDEDNKYALCCLGFRLDKYENVNKKDTIDILYEAIGETSDIYTIAENFNAALAVSEIGADDSDEWLETANPEFEGVRYCDIKDEELKKWISEMMGEVDFESVENFKENYILANCLYLINNSIVQNIENNLAKYAKELGIESNTSYIKYTKLSSQTSANKKIVNALSDNPATNTNELKDVIEAAIESSSSDGSSGGSSGGSSSSSNKSGVTQNSGMAAYVSTQPSETKEKTESVFKDMNSAEWAEEAVNKLAEAGIVSGDENGNFRPNDVMKREEFIKMLVLATGNYDENAECNFTDTNKEQWHYSYIASAFNKGIVMGVSDVLFGTGVELTRQDMAVLCRRCKDELNVTIGEEVFVDDSDISDYAKEAVYELYKSGMINGMGDGSFSPKFIATRAQGAMIIYNLFVK